MHLQLVMMLNGMIEGDNRNMQADLDRPAVSS